ncbi:MAG: hypothetical protein J6Y02_23635 [Pseudobutyrivibrio sp.]|nr:hypothetical protein [Pseudobutyrivibrio sp.]
MWKFTAHYENFNGEERSKELRFNLSASDIRTLQYSKEGGIDKYYQKLVDEGDSGKLYQAFEDLIRISYGVISDDGERFIKSEEEYSKFHDSPAYDAFMEYILTSEDGAAKFITGILPKKYMDKVNSEEGKKIAAEHGIDISSISNK